MTQFDLNLLKALEALIDTGSVTRAAHRLGLSQPAVSGMLVRLREAFGDPLFVRAQRGLVPTPRALEIADDLRRLLSEVEVLVQPGTFDHAHAQRTFRIAATDYAQSVLIIPLLHALRRTAPGVRLSVCSVGKDFGEELARAELDIALVTPDMATETLRSRKLFDEDYVCILRTGHPAVGRLDLATLCALDHAIMSHDGTQFRGATDAALAALGYARRVVATLPSFLVLIELVRQTDVIALIPRRISQRIGGVSVVEPPLNIAGFEKTAVWHERLHHDPAHRWLREQLFALSTG